MASARTTRDVAGTAPGTEPPAPSERPIARHLLPDTATVAPDGRLSVGGVDVLDLVGELGTPLFVYDAAHLRARCSEAVAAFGPGVAYATKAFLCKAMARVALDAGMSLDVSTAGELATALAAGAPPDRIVLHGNNKSDEELETAHAAGVARLVVDSFDEIDRLARVVAAAPRADGRDQPVLVRVTPGVEAHTHEYVMTGQEDSKFGFSLASGAADRAAALLDAMGGVELVGVHAHIGSQIFRLDAYEREIAALVPYVERHELRELCVGGGLGVAYVAGEEAPTIATWAAFLRGACDAAGLAPAVSVTAEPGRAIVANAALTCYRVGTVKELPGIRTYVAVDGGMSDNPRPVLYGSGYEAFLPRATDAERPFAARVVGKHCESGDVLVADARLPADVAVGDVLATPVTGAYGFSMASNYNRVPRPAVVFVEDGAASVVVRREMVEDLLRLEP
ncbi:MAG TPA: diaminopimelate decarboxylase [Acidimicrobiales bacterium]|nr:diaminopimelate decarboxylase [Acidimicrobiales bacterium]